MAKEKKSFGVRIAYQQNAFVPSICIFKTMEEADNFFRRKVKDFSAVNEPIKSVHGYYEDAAVVVSQEDIFFE